MQADEFRRWARFGVDQDGVKYIPVGGTCLIVYLVSRRDGSLLVGKVNGADQAEYWKNEAIYLHRPEVWVGKWFVPCGFLHFGEAPADRANDLVKNNLNGVAESLVLTDVVSYTEKSEYYPGYNHWHVNFVFEVRGLKLGERPPWWDTLEYVPIGELSYEKIGMAGAEVMKKVGLVRSP